ncbi:MAG: zf-HC2 domain-containing protein [Planctomycetota bacterium]
MGCRDVRGRLVEYLDGAAERSCVQAVDRHLRDCPSCARFFDEHRAAWALLDIAPEVAPSAALRSRLHGIPLRERQRRRRWLASALTLAAAAAIAVAVVLARNDVTSVLGGRVPGAAPSVADEAIIAQLDLIENLDFLREHAIELDAHRELALLEILTPLGEAETDGR